MAVEAVFDEVRQAIEATDQAFCAAFNAGDIEKATRETYTEDALVLPPGAPLVRGRDEIARFWRAAADQMGIAHVDLSTVELAVVDGAAHQVGRAVLGLSNEQQVTAKYVVIWHQVDGAWRWHIDIWNTDE